MLVFDSIDLLLLGWDIDFVLTLGYRDCLPWVMDSLYGKKCAYVRIKFFEPNFFTAFLFLLTRPLPTTSPYFSNKTSRFMNRYESF